MKILRSNPIIFGRNLKYLEEILNIWKKSENTKIFGSNLKIFERKFTKIF